MDPLKQQQQSISFDRRKAVIGMSKCTTTTTEYVSSAFRVVCFRSPSSTRESDSSLHVAAVLRVIPCLPSQLLTKLTTR